MPLSVSQYFRVVLPALLRRSGRQASELGVNVRFTVTGRGGGTWTIRFRPPHACVVPGAEWKADLEIRITSTEMLNMIAGHFDAQRAMRQGNVAFAGDLQLIKCLALITVPTAATALLPHASQVH